MNKPMIQIHDLESGKIINREMTDDEFAAHQMIVENEKKQFEQYTAKNEAKSELLKRLGITEAEAKLLLN